eukprot:7540294-Alexandrium_andersonii.AAC.1
MAEPTDARHCLVDRIVAQAAFTKDRVRQDGPGIAVFEDQDSQKGIAAVLGEKAIVHCHFRYYMLTRDRTHVRDIGHSPAHAVRAP